MKLGTNTPRLTVVVALNEPEVPVMVSVYCPRLAALVAVSVNVLDPIAGFGAKEAVTPLGRPDTERFTLPVNPFWGVTFKEDVAEVPWPTLRLFPQSVKLGASIPTATVVVALNEPEVPVMVSVYCPTLAALLAVSVNVLKPVVGFGANDAVTPLGRPAVTARFTLPVNPFWGFTLT